MNGELHTLAIDPLTSKCLMNLIKSPTMMSKWFFTNLSVNPSGPGAFSPPQAHMAALISSMVNGTSKASCCWEDNFLNLGLMKAGQLGQCSINLLEKILAFHL